VTAAGWDTTAGFSSSHVVQMKYPKIAARRIKQPHPPAVSLLLESTLPVKT
jgi:hypothetical protein